MHTIQRSKHMVIRNLKETPIQTIEISIHGASFTTKEYTTFLTALAEDRGKQPKKTQEINKPSDHGRDDKSEGFRRKNKGYYTEFFADKMATDKLPKTEYTDEGEQLCRSIAEYSYKIR